MRWIWPCEKAQSIMGFFQIFFLLFLPVVILVICYGKIIYMLSRRISNEDLTSSPEVNGVSNKFQQAKRNTLITFAIVAFCFIICWSQNQFLYLMYNLGYPVDFEGTYFNFTVFMVFINCTINPFIYLVKHKDYQVALSEFCGCHYSRTEGDRLQSSSNSGPQQVSVETLDTSV